jgi:hypothetical protein
MADVAPQAFAKQFVRRSSSMETEWYNRAEAIQKRITQLKDSL